MTGGMVWALLILYLGTLALGQGTGQEELRSPETPSSLGAPRERDLEGKSLFPDWRHRGPSLERVNPRFVLLEDQDAEGGCFRIALPYVQVSRKDMALLRLNDPDCPEYDLRTLKEVLGKPELAELRPWGREDDEGRKMQVLEERARRLRDGQCPGATWNLPYSSVLATQFVAGKLKRAWERFEDRYFWRTVTDLNNPTYWFPFCGLGFARESFSEEKRSPIDFVPPGSLPPELGALLTEDILNLVSTYKGRREATPNWVPESEGQFRKPLYLPFVPTIRPDQFCDGLPLKLPVLYIPAIAISVCGVTVWTSPDYPDRPWLLDEGEANARIQGSIRHAYSVYYRDYLLEALGAVLLPLSTLEGNFKQISDALDRLENSSDPLKEIGTTLEAIEGLMYFPVPWQAPLLGGGAVITPVYDFLYPDPIRTGVDILTIYDMVASLLKGESLSFIEKVALGLYYLEPILTYLDQPLLPGLVDTSLRDVPAVDGAIGLIYNSMRNLAWEALLAFRSGVEGLATRAFGNEAMGKAFASGVRILLKPLEEIFASSEPRYFVRATLRLLSSLDSFLLTFTGKGYGFHNRVNGITLSPGLWRFEELKRVFPPSSPLTQRLFGYSSFFAAWDTLAATIIPDFNARWANPAEYTLALASRLVGLWHVPLRIDLCPLGVTVRSEIPRYMPLPPYFLPFVGERIAWGWFSVPEGHVIPLAKGIPGAPIPALGADHPLAGQGSLTGREGFLVEFYENEVLQLRKNVKMKR